MASNEKKQFVKDVIRAGRLYARLEEQGIKYEYKTRTRYENLTFRCGFLDDGMVIKTTRLECSGKPVYHLRHILKEHNFRWDPKHKVWWLKPGDADEDLVASKLLRELANA